MAGSKKRKPPESFHALVDHAIELHNRGEYWSALGYGERAALLESDDFDVLILMGSCYGFLAQHDRAIEVLQRATILYPTSRKASFYFYAALADGEYNDESFAEIKRFLAIGDSSFFTEVLVSYMKASKMALNGEAEEIIVADMKEELRSGKSELFDIFAEAIVKVLNKKSGFS